MEHRGSSDDCQRVSEGAETGPYYLLVFCHYNRSDPVETYSLAVTEIVEPDGDEPGNNESSGAILLTSGVADSSGYIASQGDIDWYQIDASVGNLLRVDLTQGISPVAPDVFLFGPSDLVNPVWRVWNTDQIPVIDSGDLTALESGSYYVAVICHYDRSDPTEPYIITVTLTP